MLELWLPRPLPWTTLFLGKGKIYLFLHGVEAALFGAFKRDGVKLRREHIFLLLSDQLLEVVEGNRNFVSGSHCTGWKDCTAPVAEFVEDHLPVFPATVSICLWEIMDLRSVTYRYSILT